MIPDVLRVLHAPGYAPAMDDKVIARIEDFDADSVGVSEAYKIAGTPLHNRPGHRAFCGRSDRDTRAVKSPMGDAGDNPILVRDDHRIVYRSAAKVTDPNVMLWRKYAPERWLTVLTYEWDNWATERDVTHINPHPSPYFAGPRKWRRVMDAAIRAVHAAKARGELVVLTGDLQTSRARPLLEEAGLTVWSHGVDYFAWSGGLKRVTGETFNVDRLDHPWLCATFVAVA